MSTQAAESIGQSVEQNPTVRLLTRLQIWDDVLTEAAASGIEGVSVFLNDPEWGDAAKETLKRKLGNCLGAMCFAGTFGDVVNDIDQLGDNHKRKKLAEALFAFQFLADVVDTYIDSTEGLSGDEVVSLYTESTDIGVIRYLNLALDDFFEEVDPQIVTIYKTRLIEFALYQKASISGCYTDYQAALLSLYPEAKRLREEKDILFPTNDSLGDLDLIEFGYSRGGTTSVHRLLRAIAVGANLTECLKLLNSGTLFDAANFGLDHLVDIFRDGGFPTIEDFISNSVDPDLPRSMNAVHVIVCSRLGIDVCDLTGVSLDKREAYVSELRQYFGDLLSRAKHSLRELTGDVYSLLFMPMVLYFLREDGPDEFTANSLKVILTK